jgi:hypothetical protein
MLNILDMIIYDSPTPLALALFWGWILCIIFNFIKAAKGKRKKGACTKAHGLLSCGHYLFSFSLCGFYEMRWRKCNHAKPVNTHHLPEESTVFAAHLCDPRRRLGASFKAPLYMQNIRQRCTPACAGGRGAGVFPECLRTRPLPEESAIFKQCYRGPIIPNHAPSGSQACTVQSSRSGTATGSARRWPPWVWSASMAAVKLATRK